MSKKKTKNSKETSEIRSKFTPDVPLLLKDLGVSVAVTTYQAGKLFLLRSTGSRLNAHFRSFLRPMGLCVDKNHIHMGDLYSIIKFHNIPGACNALESPIPLDACYLPRNIHITGKIDIHEMETDSEGNLWFVNTLYSTLCKLDYEHSFVPVWRPDFVTEMVAEDRCHLNGLCMIDGRPKYMTALGRSDMKGGWRENKRNGGILIDIETDEIVFEGLSMPHSPRWYRGKLWVLESGEGSLATLDLERKEVTTVAQLPGFVRGLDFVGNLAFIGLSKIRDSAFSGLPIVERIEEPLCGVWVVDIDTGETVGHVEFVSGVAEVFGVKAVPALFPEVRELFEPLQQNSITVP
ncbi:TIGR03032 family protein [Sulfurimonas sp. HSL1-2]|uniref:TIGR03032 family protein n=1 Tax=Thiomicrolovo zhangzhouensis TaxID=3131933 RepID=UPI0031F980A5